METFTLPYCAAPSSETRTPSPGTAIFGALHWVAAGLLARLLFT